MTHAKAEKPSRDKLAWAYADELLRDDAYCGARGFDVRDIEEAYIGGYDEGFRAMGSHAPSISANGGRCG